MTWYIIIQLLTPQTNDIKQINHCKDGKNSSRYIASTFIMAEGLNQNSSISNWLKFCFAANQLSKGGGGRYFLYHNPRGRREYHSVTQRYRLPQKG